MLLTEDKDFGQLVYASSVQSPGVILVRFPGNAREDLAKTVLDLVRRAEDKLHTRFVVIQPGRIRISERPVEIT